MSNLVNGVSHFGFIFLLKYGKKKKQDDTFLRKTTRTETESPSIMISVDWKFTVFPVKLKLQGKSYE